MGRFVTIAATGALLATVSAFPAIPVVERSDNSSNNDTTPYDFADIPVSKDLNWIPCFDRFLCTNLEVPLDYEDDSANTTNIAFIKLEGGNGTGQDILFNPGGPGGSGVSTLIGLGDQILQQFGDGFNLVSFDPRGVNNSGPSLTCFPDDPNSRSQYNTGIANLNQIPFSERFQRAKAYGERCTAVNADTDAKYVGTPAVAQDMLYFTQLQAKTNGESVDDALVWYYGVSYGTAIGQTFAALFPDKVGRMILDGNVLAANYYKGDQSSTVVDTDAAVRSFFQYCVEAGSSKCSFLGNSTTPTQLENRYRALQNRLQAAPFVVSDPAVSAPGVITRPQLDNWVFQQLYQPVSLFPVLDKAISGLEKGNATFFLIANGYLTPSSEEEDILPTQDDVPNPNYSDDEALTLITCVDVNTRFSIKTVQQYEGLVKQLENISYYGGFGIGTGNLIFCNGFDIVPPKSQYFNGFTQTQTHVPILFINSLRDPITPLVSAQKASQYFPGSVVLAQDTTGHSHLAVKSTCTITYIQEYLDSVTLPKAGTVCEGDIKPLVNTSAQNVKRGSNRP